MDQYGPKWTNMDQRGPRGTKMVKSSAPADREVGALGPIFSSPPSEEAPLLKMVRSENHFAIIVIMSSLSSMTTSSDMILRPLSICDHLLDCLVTFPQLSHVLRHACTFIPEQHDGNEEYKIGQPCHAALELFQVLSQICLLQSVTNLGDVR